MPGILNLNMPSKIQSMNIIAQTISHFSDDERIEILELAIAIEYKGEL